MKKIKFLQKKKTRNLILSMVKIASFLLVSIMAIIVSLNSPFLTIRDYTITIEQKENELTELIHIIVSKALNEKTFFVKHNFYYFLFPNKLQANIKMELSWVSSVGINYRFFNIYDLHIKEREVFGTYCLELNCLLIDVNGEVFSKTFLKRRLEFISSQALFLNHTLSDKTSFNKLIEIVGFLNKNDIFITKVYYSNNKFEKIESDSLTILLDTNNSIYSSTRALYIALVKIPDKNIHYLDIKNPLKIKYKNE